MRVMNLTDKEILCFIDENTLLLKQKGFVDVNDFEIIKICHKYPGYSTDGAGRSKLLKILNMIDDPFKLRRDYYIVVDSEIMKSQLRNVQQLTISPKIVYLNYKIRTYYEYFQVQCDGKNMVPNRVCLPGIEELKMEFIKNARKLKWWDVFMDGLVEPILFEAVGLFLIYKLFSFSIGTYAWFIIVPFLLLDVIILIIKSCKLTAKKWIQQFEEYLEERVIRENCYISRK